MEQLYTNHGVSSTETISTQTNGFKSRMQFNRWLSMGCILFLVWFTGVLHAQTGRSCATPDVISSLPFSGSGFDTAGFNNITSTPCNSNYIGGDDYVFTYTATSTNQIQITTSGTATWVGIHVTNGCPNDVATTCIAFAGSSSANPQLVTPNLQIGVTYFFTISTFPSPQSTAFNINVIELIPTSRQTAQSGNWSDPNTWIGGEVPTIVDFVTINTGHAVVIDIVNITCQSLTIDGTLNYATSPTSFSVNGDLTVNPGGLFNVFQGTTGKQLIARGNIINNGRIDLNIGSTTATTGNLNLAGSSVQTVSGSGVWGGTVSSTTTTNTVDVINSLTFANTSSATPNIIWNVDGVRIKSVLNTTTARVDLNGNKIYLSNFGSTLGTITMPIGTGFMNGTFARWWTTGQTGTAITAGSDPTNATSRYPFLNGTGLNRAFYISRSSSSTTGNVAGYLAVTYNDTSGITTGLSVADGAYTITDRANANWSVSTENGYNYVSGTHRIVAFLNEGLFVTSNSSARLMNLNGVVGNFQLGSVTPAAQRIDITTPQLIAEPFYLGTDSAEIPFLSIASGSWNNPTTWNKNAIPTCDDFATVVNGHTVTVNSATNVAKGVTVATGGTLSIGSGDLTVGCTLNNNTFTNNGELNVSSGVLNVNGNMIHNAGSIFNQSGGQIIVDGNNSGDASTSVASGVSIVQLSSQFINWTGGELVIVDPHANSTASNSFTYTNSIEHVNVPNTHTLRLGNGVSTDQGGNATNGFRLNTFPGSRRILLGNLEVNTLGGTNRNVTTTFALGFSGNLVINTSSEVTFATSYVAGNVINDGVFTSTSGFFLSNFSNGVVSASSSAQSISGSGLFRNNATTPTANFASLTINNNNATGVTLNVPVSVSGTLNMTSGIINTSTTNLLTLGTATAAGTLSGTPSSSNMVNGPFARTIASGNANSNFIHFPVGKGTSYAPVWLAPATTAVTNMRAEAFNGNSGTANVSIINLSSSRRWEAPIVSGTVTDLNVRLGDGGILNTSIPVQAPSADGEYTNVFGSVATAIAGETTQSNSPISGTSYSGFLSFADSNSCSGTPTPGNTIASANNICLGQSVTLSLQNVTTGTGVTYQWKSSTDGVQFVNIDGATNHTLVASPTVITYYLCEVTCASSASTTASTDIQINFANEVTSTTPGTRCGEGTVVLAATTNANNSIRWFDDVTGGNVVGNGNSLTTPTINTTTTYYAAAFTSSNATGGARLAPAANSATSAINYGLVFTAFESFTLNSVDVYLASATAGNVVMALQNSSGTTLLTTTIAVPAGNVTTPVQFTLPLNWEIDPGVGYRILAVSGPSMVREASLGGFPYSIGSVGSVTNGFISGTSTTYYYFYNWNFSQSCFSPRVPVVATVTTPPAFTLSSNADTICNGDTSTAFTITAGANDYDTFVWSPTSGVSGDAINGWTFNPSVSTNYSLTASQSSGDLCSTSVSVQINVNPVPSALIITPSVTETCIDDVVTLAASGGTLPNIVILQEDFNGATNSWTTINNSTTTGTGNIANIAWTLRPNGYVRGVTYNSNDSSQFYLSDSDNGGSGNITDVSLTSPSFSTVDFENASISFWHFYQHLSGGTAKLQYSIDDVNWVDFQTYNATVGASNSFVNATVALPSGALNQANVKIRFQYNVPYGWRWAVDNVTILGAQSQPVTWSPITNLYIDAAATVTYVANTPSATVYYKPTADGSVQFTATATTAQSCFTSQNVSIVTNPTPTAPIAATQDFCANANPTVADLVATGDDLKWYDVATGGTPLLVTAALTSGNYYVSQTLLGCESPRTTVQVNVNDCNIGWANLQWPASGTIGTCGDYTVYGQVYKLGVTEAPGPNTNITAWFGINTSNTDPATWDASAWQLGTYNVQAGNNDEYQYTFNNLPAGTYYIASRFQFTGGEFWYGGFNSGGGGAWDGTNNVSSVVTVIETIAPSASNQTFCGASTVASLVATGTSLQWYDVETGGTPLAANTPIITGTYYVSQTLNGCEGPRATIEVTVNITPAPTASAQVFCGDPTVAVLVATGSDLQWYDVATGGVALASNTQLISGTYYVSQTLNNCEGPRTMVQVTVNPSPVTPDFNETVCSTDASFDLNTITNPILGTSINTVFSENFDASAALPTGWQVHKVSGTGTTTWVVNTTQSVSAPNSMRRIFGGSSDGFQDDYLVMPQFTVPASGILTYQERGQWMQDYVYSGVLIATNGNGNPSSSTYVQLQETANIPNNAWQLRTIDLSAYAGQQVYIAFRYSGTFAHTWWIDDIKIEGLQNNSIVFFDSNNVQLTNTIFDPSTATPGNNSFTYTITNGNNCSSTGNINILVNATASPTASNQNFCNAATVADLVATGTSLQWYDVATGGTPLTSNTELDSGTYYVSQTLNGCEGPRASIEVTVNITPAPTASTQSFCGNANATVADLVATGDNLQWYDVATGGTALTSNTVLVSGTYYVSQTLNNCESTRTTVQVNVNDCNIGWANLQWPASGTINTCGEYTVYGQVWKLGVTEAPGPSANITAWFGISTTNTDPSTWDASAWVLGTYNVQVGNNDEYQHTFTNLPAGTYYIASRFQFTGGDFWYGGFNSSGGGAWNGTTNVSSVLTVEEVPAPTGDAVQSITVPLAPDATLANLVVSGTNVTWYATLADAQAGTNALPLTTELVSGNTYYAVSIVNGCRSAALAVTVTVNLDIRVFDFAQLRVYPNPVIDRLTITFDHQLERIEVYNMLGQMVRFQQPKFTETEVEMTNLPAATYIVRIYSNDAVKEVKVIKK